MSQVYATPRKGRDFGKGVAAAKKAGGKFDGSCWVIPAANIARFKLADDSEDDYLRRNYLVRVEAPGAPRPALPADLATNWQGPQSMDPADSIF